jgi:hypothetical protein
MGIGSFYIQNIIFPFYKTSYPNEEVNRTEPFPSVSVLLGLLVQQFIIQAAKQHSAEK